MKINTQVFNSRKYFGEAVLLLVTLLWGGTFVIIKVALNDISSMLFVSLRFLIASMFLLPFAIKIFKTARRDELLMGFFLSIILFVSYATQTVGLKFTSATKSGFITGTFIMFLPALQLLIERRKPTRGAMVGSGIVIIGLLFLSVKDIPLSNFFNELGGNFNIGDFFTLLCAFCYAVYIVYLDIVSKKANHLLLVYMQIFVTAVLASLTTLVFSSTGIEPINISPSNSLIFGLIYCSIFATLITIFLQTKYQKEVTPTKAGIIFSFEPMFAAIFAVIILSEQLYYYSIIGSVLIFSGLIISELMERNRQSLEIE